MRYGLQDCYQLATHGRWLKNLPHLRRGLKRGFTFYRHHPGQPVGTDALAAERLLVAASPNDELSDSHWLRADIDHHFVREALSSGVDYRDHVEVSNVGFRANEVRLTGSRESVPFELAARFVVDASGPAGFLARQLSIPSALGRTHTRSSLVYSHFSGAQMVADVVPGLPPGPYPDDWAAVHHIVDEGWMYSLRFDDGVTSAGFLLTPSAARSLERELGDPESVWRELLRRYPILHDAFDGATPLMPIAYRKDIQHRLTRAGGERWVMMPHAFAFVDPLFSTGIAWSLRAVERLALAFESVASGSRVPEADFIERYDRTLSAEADQIDLVVAGAYEAMAHFDLFAAQAMLYFAAVSYAEASQRLAPADDDAWNGFLGVGDPVLNELPAESVARLSRITRRDARSGSEGERQKFVDWLSAAIEPRNIAGLADRKRANLYPVDFEALVDGHDRLGMSRSRVLSALPRLRGMSPPPDLSDASRRNFGLAQKPEALPFFPRADVAPQRSQQETGNGAG